ncbi:MAG: hypothetical protein HFE49_08735 [Clostridia bacterium]|nr:hypothetical protein [Clostridia bacterium]
MEEVFDKLKEQASKAKDGALKLTKTVIGKTNNVVSQTKLKFAISDTEDKIKEIYTEMGKSIYDCYKATGDADNSLIEKCGKIDALMIEVAEFKEQLAELKETVKCDECGAYNHSEDVYCSKCGAKLLKDSGFSSEDDDNVVTINPTRPEADRD